MVTFFSFLWPKKTAVMEKKNLEYSSWKPTFQVPKHFFSGVQVPAGSNLGSETGTYRCESPNGVSLTTFGSDLTDLHTIHSEIIFVYLHLHFYIIKRYLIANQLIKHNNKNPIFMTGEMQGTCFALVYNLISLSGALAAAICMGIFCARFWSSPLCCG